MKFSVPVFYVVEADSANEAEEKVNTKLYTGVGAASFEIGKASAQMEGEKKPEISSGLVEFFREVIAQNNDDPDGTLTTLAYARKEFDEMDHDHIADWSDEEGDYNPDSTGLSVEDHVAKLNNELTALTEKYGGNMVASQLFDY